MDAAQLAEQLLGDWANNHVVPRVEVFLTEYSFAIVTVAGNFGKVQIGRNRWGKPYVSYTNPLAGPAIKKALDQHYHVTDGGKDGKKFVLLVMPKA
ncbi:MAG: hypothetical protein ABIR37_01000 [Candidatus Saccharimonadales bacterium]